MSETAADYADRTLNGIRAKADHNKAEAMRCIAVGLIASLAAPLFIGLGDGMWLGKIVPSVLSVVAAFTSGWLQLRRPQLLWALYRGAQREVEDQQTRYSFGVGDYAAASDPDKILAERVADIAPGPIREVVRSGC